jgi:hypothetical protein
MYYRPGNDLAEGMPQKMSNIEYLNPKQIKTLKIPNQAGSDPVWNFGH